MSNTIDGSTIVSERARLGMTQDDLAQELGVSRSTIVRWENDPSSITLKYLELMLDLFGCSAEYVLGRCAERVPAVAS